VTIDLGVVMRPPDSTMCRLLLAVISCVRRECELRARREHAERVEA
jgi:hypothetical protein